MDTITPERVDDNPSARMTNRMSGRSGRVEVLPRADRRRSWTLEQKREIVSESLGPELTPTEVARSTASAPARSTPGWAEPSWSHHGWPAANARESFENSAQGERRGTLTSDQLCVVD